MRNTEHAWKMAPEQALRRARRWAYENRLTLQQLESGVWWVSGRGVDLMVADDALHLLTQKDFEAVL